MGSYLEDEDYKKRLRAKTAAYFKGEEETDEMQSAPSKMGVPKEETPELLADRRKKFEEMRKRALMNAGR